MIFLRPSTIVPLHSCTICEVAWTCAQLAGERDENIRCDYCPIGTSENGCYMAWYLELVRAKGVEET